MGLFNLFKTKPTFAVWSDPPVEPPVEEWNRRLDAYAHTCANQLAASAVPLFQSAWPYDGKNHYQDSFWLIACDVEFAERSRVILEDLGPKPKPGFPPATPRGRWDGTFMGKALLLTPSGVWCVAEAWGVFSGGDTINDHCDNVGFTEICRPIDYIRTADWGWSNRGKWKRNPNASLYRYGVLARRDAIHFEEFHTGSKAGDGKGTSAALSSFLKANGSVRWPRGFVISGF